MCCRFWATSASLASGLGPTCGRHKTTAARQQERGGRGEAKRPRDPHLKGWIPVRFKPELARTPCSTVISEERADTFES